jgi:hypothetical protein
MALIGTLLNKGIKMSQMIEHDTFSAYDLQKKELKKLLRMAKNTQFGKKYLFSKFLTNFKKKDKENFYVSYKTGVPVFHSHEISS